MYDVRARLGGDGFLPQGSMAAIAQDIDGVEAVDERLISRTQAEVDTPDGSIFVAARIIGVDMSDGGPDVNGVEAVEGRAIEDSERGEPIVLVERNFAVYYEIPEQGELRLGGDVSVRYVGHAVSPEYFLVIEEGSFVGQANLVVVFTSLETAQDLAGRQGMVNDLVLTVEPGADLKAVETALLAEASERHPDAHLKLMRTEDDQSYLALTRDPEGDQKIYNVFAVILFAGSAFAALNFAARMVETQRREIGTAMALGMNPLSIAVRPLLVGVQIGVLGVVFGVGVGAGGREADGGRGRGVRSAARLPDSLRPHHRDGDPLQHSRPARIVPRDAGSGRRGAAARRARPARREARLVLPGRLARGRRHRERRRAPCCRAGTGDRGSAHTHNESGDLGHDFVDFESAEEEVVHGIEHGALQLNIQFVDFESEFWRPTATEGELAVDRPGIVLARKAAADLGVGEGDEIKLTHPMRTGPGAFTIVASSPTVLAVHPHPLRFNAYVDIRQVGIAGLDGLANTVTGAPARGEHLTDVKRVLFAAPGVATVQGLAEASKSVRDVIEQVSGIFWVVQVFVLGLGLLIAFNTANINSDERARDHATMFAYGVSVRRVVSNLAVEGLALGALATIPGILFGYVLLLWVVVLSPETYPDMAVLLSVDVPEMAAFLAMGVGVVAVAPTFTVRKLRRMYIPGTLRVLE